MKKKLLKFFAFFAITPLVSISAISCTPKRGFYLANFENYISDELLNEFHNQYSNFNFRSYATNEDLERNFTRNYDVAIPSTYLVAKIANSGELELIDWSKFGLYQLDENGFRTDKPIKTAADALTLFTDKARKILTGIYYLEDFSPSEGGLLNYCVPYFLQDFIFGYKSEQKIDFGITNDSELSWNNIIGYAKNNVGPNKKINRIAMIDDYRSIYSIPRLMQTSDLQHPTVNPGVPSDEPEIPIQNNNKVTYSIDTFEETYKYLSDGFARNSFLLNSDSNTILNNFVDNRGSDAAILYNGDALYSLQGGDNYSSDNAFDTWIKSMFTNNQFNFHISRPNNTLMALDALVINKNSKNKDMAYDVIKKIALENADASLYSDQTKTSYQTDNPIFKTDDNGNYLYGPMINFSFIQYSSPLKNLYTYVVNSKTKFDSIGGYFTNDYEYLKTDGILNEFQYKNYIDTLVDTFNIQKFGTSNNTLEQNLSDINKSNMYYAYNVIRKNF